MKLTPAAQDYLKAIFKIGDRGIVQTSELSLRLCVSPASVTGMIKKLAEQHLVKYERHRGVILTPAGRKIALEVLRHHRLIELYLTEALGYTWDNVHDEAEKLEHHISEDFEDRISNVLGNPQYDPHGDPIPTKDGEIPPSHTHPLSSVGASTTVHIRRVSDEQRQLLTCLLDLGIGLNTRLTVILRDEERGTVTIRKGTRVITLPLEECQHVFVE